MHHTDNLTSLVRDKAVFELSGGFCYAIKRMAITTIFAKVDDKVCAITSFDMSGLTSDISNYLSTSLALSVTKNSQFLITAKDYKLIRHINPVELTLIEQGVKIDSLRRRYNQKAKAALADEVQHLSLAISHRLSIGTNPHIAHKKSFMQLFSGDTAQQSILKLIINTHIYGKLLKR